MRRFLIFFLLAILNTSLIQSQPPDNFMSSYGQTGDDIGYDVKFTLDKKYIIIGSTSSLGSGNTDVYLLKLSEMGQGLWHKTIGGSGNDVGKAVIQLSDSGYVGAGFTTSFGNGGYDAFIFKVDKNGELIWKKTFGGTDWDFANDLVLGPDGNIYVVGNTSSFNGQKEAFILKYNLAGDVLSYRLFGGAHGSDFEAVAITTDGAIVAAGYNEIGQPEKSQMYFVKVDLNLDTVFTKRIGGKGNDMATGIVQNGEGELVICGGLTFTNNPHTESVMLGYGLNGDSLWSNHYYYHASIDDEKFEAVAKSKHLSTLTAYIRNVPVPNASIQSYIFVSNPKGWAYLIKPFGGYEDDYIYSIDATDDGGYVGIGYTESFMSTGKDIFMFKVDSTILEYAHITQVPIIHSKESVGVFYKENDLVEIQVPNGFVPIRLEVRDVLGRTLFIKEIKTSVFDIDLAEFNDLFFLITVKFEKGNSFHTKVLKR